MSSAEALITEDVVREMVAVLAALLALMGCSEEEINLATTALMEGSAKYSLTIARMHDDKKIMSMPCPSDMTIGRWIAMALWAGGYEDECAKIVHGAAPVVVTNIEARELTDAMAQAVRHIVGEGERKRWRAAAIGQKAAARS